MTPLGRKRWGLTGHRRGRLALGVVAVLSTQVVMPAARGASAEAPGFDGRVAAEVTSMRTAMSRTFDLGDGSLRTDVSAAPINYRLDDGSWAPIDNTLVPSSDPLYVWTNAANAYRASIGGSLASGVKVEHNGAGLAMSISDAAGETEQTASTVTYREAFPGVDVRYEVLGAELKELVVLDSPSARRSFEFDLDLSPNSKLVADDGGGFDVVAGSGEAALHVPAAFAEDAQGEVGPATLTLAQVDGRQKLQLELDDGWASSADRSWPVSIDPTISATPTKDCYIDSLLTTSSFCTGTTMKVGKQAATTIRRGLMTFDVSAIPSAAQVTAATAKLFLNNTGNSTNSQSVSLHQMTTAWGTTASPTWASPGTGGFWTMPGGDFAATALSSQTMLGSGVPVGGWATFDSTAAVQAWVNGSANYGLISSRRTKRQPTTTRSTSAAARQRPPAKRPSCRSYTYRPRSGCPAPRRPASPFNALLRGTTAAPCR